MKKFQTALLRNHQTLRLVALLALAAVPGLADAAAGRFLFVSGPAQIVATNGQARAAHRGDTFDQGETIATAATTTAQLRMEDGNMISVRPNTRLRIDQFSYHGHPQAGDKNYMTLTKGAFRSITGAISKENYRITTPDATIGIRGTDHEAMYVPPGSSTSAPSGTYDKVNTGRTYLATPQGSIDIRPNQAGYVASAAAAPRLLPVIPDFLKSSSAPPRNNAAASGKQDSAAASGKQDTAASGGKQDSAAAGSSSQANSGSSASTDTGSASSSTSTASTDTGSASGSSPAASSASASPAATPAPTAAVTPLPPPPPATTAPSAGQAGFAVAAIGQDASGTSPVGGASPAVTNGDSYTIDANGQLTALTLHHALSTSSVLEFNSGTSHTSLSASYTDPDTGDVIHWGRWSVPDANGSYTLAIDGQPITPSSDFHYMYSNNTTTVPQLAVLTGNFNYTAIPGKSTLTDGLQHAGTVTSASMGVNFSTQTITSYNLDMTVNDYHWVAQQQSPTSLKSSDGTLHNQYTVNLSATVTPTTGTAAPITGSGYAQGAFVGSKATSTINMFGLQSTTGLNAIGTVLMKR